jgi:hypothetical protein
MRKIYHRRMVLHAPSCTGAGVRCALPHPLAFNTRNRAGPLAPPPQRTKRRSLADTCPKTRTGTPDMRAEDNHPVVDPDVNNRVSRTDPAVTSLDGCGSCIPTRRRRRRTAAWPTRFRRPKRHSNGGTGKGREGRDRPPSPPSREVGRVAGRTLSRGRRERAP